MRIAPIRPGTRPELAAQEAQITAERGRVSPLYQVLLNSPPIAHGWEQMLSAVRNRSSLPAALRELVILRVAVLNRASYEFDAHAPIALREGASQAAVNAMRAVQLASDAPLSPAERVAIGLTDAMTRDIDGKRSANPSFISPLKLRTSGLRNQRTRRGGHGSTADGTVPGASGGVSCLWPEGAGMGRGQRGASGNAAKLVRTCAALAGAARRRQP